MRSIRRGAEDLEPKPRGKKKVGKKEADMSGLPVNRVNHYMTEEELIAEFGENGWKQLRMQSQSDINLSRQRS